MHEWVKALTKRLASGTPGPAMVDSRGLAPNEFATAADPAGGNRTDSAYIESERANQNAGWGRAIHSRYLSSKLLPFADDGEDCIVSDPGSGPPLGAEPVPPQELWEGYADTAEDYLACGRQDTSTLLAILEHAGESPLTLKRVLDFGCAAARMLRFYPLVADSELWGVDINAKHVVWSQQHLGARLNFATTTTAPHLPFEDHYFDLVYSASVFTHISDLADAWFLELRRILRPGGYAYITIHDEHTLELLYTKYKDQDNFREFVEQVRQFDERTSVRSKAYASFTIGADPYSQVFYDADVLVRKWRRLARIVSVTKEAHDHQTALLFQKRD
jgi:SAM-dependent methyltransferase